MTPPATRYAILLLPSANRVYADAANGLLAAELGICSDAVLGGAVTDVAVTPVAGLDHVTFTAPRLTAEQAAYVANLSAVYALYAVEGELLRPVPLERLDRYDSDLLTIQKYPGKTNEQFTKLLLNVTVLSSRSAARMLSERLVVLDPLCGRGTTLNQALMYGWDALGVDLDTKDFEAYALFVDRWLKDKRLKHHVDHGPVRRDKKVVARRLTATLAASKEDHKAGLTQRLDVVNTDTTRTVEFLGAACADVVVADLPYGVQHGSRTAGRGLARGPLDLLADAAPVWARALRPGGAVGVSWNTHVARRDDAAQRLADAGLEVLDEGPYLALRHRVDSAIMRDVLVARKP